MIHSCVHTHSTFCDGKDTLADMAKAAYTLGIKTFGCSGHSFVKLDEFGIKPEATADYIAEAHMLKALYAGKMNILCGIELDSFSDAGVSAFDYVIGSAHSVVANDGAYYIIDGSIDWFTKAAVCGFGGNYLKLCEAYYKQFTDFIVKIRPDIVGHFDLITKFNRGNRFFDENGAEYKTIALQAVDKVIDCGCVFELNTGGISRGYRDEPYPARFLLERIFEKQGRVIITTDAHEKEKLLSGVDEAEKLLADIGFSCVTELGAEGFYSREI